MNSLPVRVVFVTSPAGRDRLRPLLMPGDLKFHEVLPRLFPHAPAAYFHMAHDGTRKSILLVTLGHGDDSKLFPRNPRPDFEEIASFV
ncbi:MAG TPA: hypothetical protein VMG98_04645 [Verrucomicrobiae bacterium]|nr:hypothetical protein [Verrucomicrobiae bacterium]